MNEPPQRKKIILVDDDRDSREWLAEGLEREGFDVIQAANGVKLLHQVEEERPDVIVLDVNLGSADGFELCRSVKRHDAFRAIPVIFVSARAGADDVKRGIQAGAVDYFTKPVELDTLRARVRDLAFASASAA